MAQEKTSKWDNDGHAKLCVALADALIAAGGSPAKQSEIIMASLATNNCAFTWEGVRKMVKWDDKATADLFLSMMTVMCPTLNEAQKEAITAEMQGRGHDVVWNGIRSYTMSKWDGTLKDDLIQALYTYSPPTDADQKKDIAAYLHTRGHTITWDAIRQHLQRLRRTAGEPGSAAATPKTTKAPKAPKTKTPRPKASVSGRKRPAQKACENSDSNEAKDGNEDDDIATPAPKRAKTEATVKEENGWTTFKKPKLAMFINTGYCSLE